LFVFVLEEIQKVFYVKKKKREKLKIETKSKNPVVLHIPPPQLSFEPQFHTFEHLSLP